MGEIRIYESNEIEFIRLKAFADMVNSKTKQFYISIKNIYFDFGQNWWYTALVTEDLLDDSEWQSVNPRDYKAIINCDSFAQMNEYATKYVDGLLNDEICIRVSY